MRENKRMASCHPDRYHVAHGLCRSCYYATNREKAILAAKHSYKRNKARYGNLAWERSLVRRYRITPEEYHSLLEKQGGVCAICKEHEPETGKIKRLAVDHCHRTLRVRGLLCRGCNARLGVLENQGWLHKAWEYLAPWERFPS